MALKTLDPTVKAAFANAGISLTPQQEHVAANATSVDWVSLIQKLAQVAVQIVPIILALFGSSTPPAKTAGAACCDHHTCCCETLKAILHSADVCSKHLCECCS